MKLAVDEALRYLGVKGRPDEALAQTVAQVAQTLTGQITPRYTYRVFRLERAPAGVRLAGTDVVLPGATAEKMLSGCDQAALLACTLGARFDQLLRSTQARDMAQAVILDACGSAWVESGCDQAEDEIAARFPGQYLTDRFSPGYGDLPLTLQSALCALLDTPRRLGLVVTESALLDPVKSVTALVGVSPTPQPARVRGCAVCPLRGSCTFSKGGQRCER